jgi:hypothetical protein
MLHSANNDHHKRNDILFLILVMFSIFIVMKNLINVVKLTSVILFSILTFPTSGGKTHTSTTDSSQLQYFTPHQRVLIDQIQFYNRVSNALIDAHTKNK